MRLDPISKHLLSGAGHRGPIVLMYHSIVPPGYASSWRYSIALERFAAHLDLLTVAEWHTRRVSDLSPYTSDTERQAVITFDDGYADSFLAFEELQRREMVATWFVVTRDIGAASSWHDPGTPPRPILTADQLRIMAMRGMEIGAHSRSHVMLTGLENQRLLDEVAGSKAELEDLLKSPVMSFAYPYGDYDTRAIHAVRSAGYSRACVTQSGTAFSGGDALAIHRVTVVNSDEAATFARKLSFADNDVSWPTTARYIVGRAFARLSEA
jgi:peptidoglycan/xylan/chitin deacetylase (PgdA/CDA1 family)